MTEFGNNDIYELQITYIHREAIFMVTMILIMVHQEQLTFHLIELHFD